MKPTNEQRLIEPEEIANLVAYVPGTGFFVDGQGRDSMRLSYCYPTPERITEGVRRLAGVMEEEMDLIHTFGSAASNLPPGPATPRPDLA